jgi:chemotaxis protein CheD
MAAVPPAPPDVLEIFLQPGEFYFGDEKTRMRTVLGSCVAILLWQPRLRIGGMCHFMLPHRGRPRNGGPLDGRYADDALGLFMKELRRTSTSPGDYRVRVCGGGSMLGRGKKLPPEADICRRNVEAARNLILGAGFQLHAEDLGGDGHRNVVFDLWSGDVWLRRVPRS